LWLSLFCNNDFARDSIAFKTHPKFHMKGNFRHAKVMIIFMKTFAENLRHARTERGLSQEQLAKLIGVKSGSVMHIPSPQSTLNRSRCAPQPREMSTATADIVHLKSTHKQTPAETFPPP
jgi:DNA-binding XRE family transcriptional regulator